METYTERTWYAANRRAEDIECARMDRHSAKSDERTGRESGKGA